MNQFQKTYEDPVEIPNILISNLSSFFRNFERYLIKSVNDDR